MSAEAAPPGRRSRGALVVKAALAATGALFMVALVAMPQAFEQNAKPFAEFVNTSVAGFITMGALLLLPLTAATAASTRKAGLAALVAAVGSLVFSALYAVVLVRPSEFCVRNLVTGVLGSQECSPNYFPQIEAAVFRFVPSFGFALLGLVPLAFLRRPVSPPAEAPASPPARAPPSPAASNPSPGPAHSPAPRPAPPVYRPPPAPAPRTVTPPVVRTPAPPPAPELQPMNSYLVLGTGSQGAYGLFRKAIAKGSPGLCITRTHPDEVRRVHGMPPSVRVHWLSKTGEKDTLNPANLEQIFAIIQEFLTTQKGAALLFDGVEYLTAEREFPKVLKFLNNLQDAVAVNKAVLLVPVNPAALGEKEVGLLSRDMKIIKS